MSYTTDVILTISLADDERADDGRMTVGLDHFRRWCEAYTGESRHPIGWPSGGAPVAGTRGHYRAVYQWCVNYLDEDAFLEAVRDAPWHRPDAVQVFFCREDEHHFRMFSLRPDREWVEVSSGVEEWYSPRPVKRFVDEPCTDPNAFERVAFVHDGQLCGATRYVRRSDDCWCGQPPSVPIYCYKDTGRRTPPGIRGLPARLRIFARPSERDAEIRPEEPR